MLFELTLASMMVAFIILAICLAVTVIQIKKTFIQAERFFSQLNTDIPKVLNNFHVTSENIRLMTQQTRDGVGHASVLFHAVGEIGTTVNQVHAALREGGKRLMNSFDVIKARIVATVTYKRQRCSDFHRSPITKPTYIPQPDRRVKQALTGH